MVDQSEQDDFDNPNIEEPTPLVPLTTWTGSSIVVAKRVLEQIVVPESINNKDLLPFENKVNSILHSLQKLINSNTYDFAIYINGLTELETSEQDVYLSASVTDLNILLVGYVNLLTQTIDRFVPEENYRIFISEILTGIINSNAIYNPLVPDDEIECIMRECRLSQNYNKILNMFTDRLLFLFNYISPHLYLSKVTTQTFPKASL